MTTVRDKRVCVAVTLWMCALMVGGAIHGLWHVHPPADVTGPVLDCDHSCTDPAHGHERHGGHGASVERCPLCTVAAPPAVPASTSSVESLSSEFVPPSSVALVPHSAHIPNPPSRAPPSIRV